METNLEDRPTAGPDSVIEPATCSPGNGNEPHLQDDESVPNVADGDLHQGSGDELHEPDTPNEQEWEETQSRDDLSRAWAELDERDEEEHRRLRRLENGRSLVPAVPLRCTICWEPVKGIFHGDFIRLDCREYYCVDCLNSAFEFSLRHETNFPPLCGCKLRMDIKSIRHALTPALAAKYDALAPEWTSWHRTYCAKCLQYIDAKPFEDQEMYSVCASCEEWTCRKCKASKAMHDDACPQDPDRQKLLQLITHKKWKQCSNCRNFIEKAFGCSHMT